MASRTRIGIGALALSASAFISLAVKESYEEKAMIPTKNDRPTLGFGSTFHPDGTPVKMGEKTTPVRALIIAQAHISKEEAKFRASLPNVKLYQTEYDIYMNWMYQYGTGAWEKSTMRRELLKSNYVAACNGLLLYKKSGGYDCSVPGNKICAGVWTRQQERHKACMEAQNEPT